MTAFAIWCRAQTAAIFLALPLLPAAAPLYLLTIAINIVFGLPAIAFFHLLLKLKQSFFANSKPVSIWAAALACLPGMLLITGGCILAATVAMCDALKSRFEWQLTLFGLPAMLGTLISVCMFRKDIHCFIYPDLYATSAKKDTVPAAGMDYPQPGATGHTEDH